ncbi:hypothetical protein [Salinibacterium sp. ZJ450]|uniref:hypothetical protein n=1 Tax=Salinibacterium sp. ZJ450 TaxID=2708338 RepID=UPI00141D855B|nr:hypothetical protein [Salinibacterium sp. ZJ450]
MPSAGLQHGRNILWRRWPGWYRGRTVHIHLKVHVNKVNVVTGQLFFDDDLNDVVYQAAP